MENNKRLQLFAILSLSMANAFVGTGISPALETIRNNFVGAPDLLIQMIVSLPSLMVIVVSFVFSAMSRRISMRGLCLIGLGLYTAGGLRRGLQFNCYNDNYTYDNRHWLWHSNAIIDRYASVFL